MAVTAVPRTAPRGGHRCPACSPEKGAPVEGATHAATGFLAGLGLGIFMHAGMHLHGNAAAAAAGQDVLFGLVAAGMALLPDADHPKASFARAAGGLSHGVSHLVSVLMGGHRQGMHSVAGITALTLTVASCADWWPNRWSLAGLGVLLAICIAAGLRATGFIRRPFDALAAGCGISAVAVLTIRPSLWWLTLLGMALHVFEDEFTGHGCALLWPLTSRRFGGDGRQPAARRRPAPARPARRPAERAPRRTGPVPSKPMCPQCWVGECEECNDRGCGCPQAVHPARPARKRKAAVPEPANPPGVTIKWADAGPDVPPYLQEDPMACPEASFGWGVPLTDAPVGWSLHPSIRQLADSGSPLLGPEPDGTEEYWRTLAVEVTGYNGNPRSALAVYLRRSLVSTADSTGDAGPADFSLPGTEELAVIGRYLDEIGFTGDRTVRLLLTACEV